MRILAVSPHPDDLEIGCGGTLLKYARRGADITALIMTDGSLGGPSEARREEQEASAGIIGIRQVLWGGFRDADLPGDREVIDTIEETLREIRPTFLFVPFGQDTHQDHRKISSAALSATRYSRNVLFYECPTSVNFHPTIFVDIGAEFDDKIASLAAHRTQVKRTHIEGLPITEIARSMAHFRGSQSRVSHAEGFQAVRLFINL
jgi:LmbE family N-acetylglucosaminyl deacetylase